MSEEEFLKRWSRRKQEAKEADDALPASPTETAAEPVPEAPAADEIELLKLPPIDSIDAATDITAFLRKNIPGELSRAALRRAWAADPAIRDFVGLAENAWDFTDPTAMPGFGPLEHTPEQIASLVERIVGGVRDTAEKLASAVPDEAKNPSSEPETARISRPEDAAPEPTLTATSVDEGQESVVAAAQPESSDDDGETEPARRRSHGGALPT
jgi:Protein of unknown function (DUF3306)